MKVNIDVDKLDFDAISSKISHLEKESIIEMMEKYYNGSTVKELIKEYNISVSLSQFVNIFPKKIVEEHCDFCRIPLVQDWTAKSSVHSMSKKPYCKICDHENHEKCTCSTCEDKRAEELIREVNRKIKSIEERYSEDNYKKRFEKDLSLEDKLYLSVLIRGGLDENIGNIMPIHTINEKLTPTESFSYELINRLIDRNTIKPHTSSPIEAFVDNEDFPNSYYMDRVIYRINIEPMDNNYSNMIKRLMYPVQEDFEIDKDFCFNMWKKIALNESIEYLLYSLDKVGFDFNPGEKTEKVFDNLLDQFSVSQIYSIIYRAVANSTKLYQETNMPRKKAANTVITLCESFGERAIAEGWNLTKYRRDYNLPETLISKIFFTSILKIAFMGFDEVPTRNI